MNISVWTIAYNNDANLLRFNDSLRETSPVVFRILNQGDSSLLKGTTDQLDRCEDIAEWLGNKSLAKAWNWCITESPTDWVLISNDDVEFAPGWWEAFHRYCREYFWIGPSYCFCIHQQLFREVGLFDEGFPYLGFEDDDYLLRMEQTSLPIMYGRSDKFPYNGDRFANFVIHHHEPRVRYDESNPNREYFEKKWPGRIPYWKLQPSAKDSFRQFL
jgi:hypothetical protein